MLDGGVGGAGLSDGADVVTYAGSPQPVTAVLPDGTATGDGTDELVGVENLVGSAFGDVVLNRTPPSDDVGTVHGRGGADRLRATGWMTGGDDDDVLRLLPGAEFVDGGPGNDRISAAATTRRDYGYLYGGAGDDVLVGGPGRDYLQGGTGDDRGSGGPQPDHLDLRGGSDQARGGDGSDLITLDGPRSQRGDRDGTWGGPGIDTITVWESRDGVTIDLRRDRVSGPGRDRISTVENLRATTRSDTLIGNAGSNRLLGDFGDDSLYGRGGSDSLSGGPGDDRADGGGGRDTCDAESTRSC